MRTLVALIMLVLTGCAGAAGPGRSETETLTGPTASTPPATRGTAPATSGTPQTTTSTAPAAPTKATTVLTDEGSGAGRTQAFTVDGAFEVRWSFTSDKSQGASLIMITMDSVDGGLVEGGGLVANQTSSGQDVWHGQTSGTYVLTINSLNGSWTLEVVDTP